MPNVTLTMYPLCHHIFCTTRLIKRKIICGVFFIFIFTLSDFFGLHLHFFELDYETFSYPLEINMTDVINALKMGKEPAYKPINKYEYTFSIKNERKCRKVESEEYEKVVILYVVKSALDHQDRRNVIRKTWGLEKRFSDVIIKRIFIVGYSDNHDLEAKIIDEYARNKDIVQAEFIDSYYNNTIKTMMGFQWVVNNCPKANFIVFADDDMYISTKNMLKFALNTINRRVGLRRQRYIENSYDAEIKNMKKINELYIKNKSGDLSMSSRKLTSKVDLATSGEILYAGYVSLETPIRDKLSKWYISLAEYPFHKYPPFINAGAYILTFTALETMYYTALYTKQFKFDDVYLSIVARKCNISPQHNGNFYYWKKTYTKETYAIVIASHGYSDPLELQKIWEEQRSLGHA